MCVYVCVSEREREREREREILEKYGVREKVEIEQKIGSNFLVLN